MKIIRYTLLTLISLVVVIMIAIAVIINFIFTSSKLSPLVENAVNENLNAKLSLRSVELTFFSTFPNFSVEVIDGTLKTLSEDTLVSFREMGVTVDPIALLKDKRVVVHKIELREPIINARVDSLGKANWDIVKPIPQQPKQLSKPQSQPKQPQKTVKPTVDNSPKQDKKETPNISLSNIKIVDGEVLFDDRMKHIYASLKGVNMTLEGNTKKQLSDMQFTFEVADALVWHNGQPLAKHLSLRTAATLALNTKTRLMTIMDSNVEINNVKFTVKGEINPDSVNAHLSLQVPSLVSVLALVPFIDNSKKATTGGSVQLEVGIEGGYKDGNIPILNAGLIITDGSLQYEGMKNGIDKLDINASLLVDLKNKSQLKIDNFYLHGASTSINLKGNIDDIFNDAKVWYSTNSTINMTELATTLPLSPDLLVKGRVRLNSEGEFTKKQLESDDYAHIKADGEIRFADVVFNIEKRIKSHFKELNMTLANTKKGLLTVNGNMTEVGVDITRFNLTVDSLTVKAQGIESIEKSYVAGKFNYVNLEGSLFSDSLEVRSGRSNVAFKMSNNIGLKFTTDTLYIRAVDNEFNMSSANVNISLRDNNLKGKINFDGIDIIVPSFPLPMSMSESYIEIDNQDIRLKKASFRVGESDMIISGLISDILPASRGEKVLRVKMDVSSSMMNMTQIAHTFNQMPTAKSIIDNMKTADTKAIGVKTDTTSEVANSSVTKPTTKTKPSTGTKSAAVAKSAAETKSSATEPSVEESYVSAGVELFVIPKNIDFDLNTDFKHIEFGRLKVSDMKGKVTLKNGVARLDNLTLETLGAQLATSIVYDSNISDGAARAGIRLGSESIDVHSVIELVPSLDTLMPMLNSFEGKLNFSLLADTKFYPGFTIHPKEINATIALRGENLVLLDGKTFSEISKLLMFKNKERNVVDSLGVQMAIDNGSVEIFPFIIQLDRYRAAIGGEHSLTNNFKYHISILKSPIPFKFGINIDGTLDNMKVGIGKTKYKFLNQPSNVKQLNEKYIELGKIISKRISEL